MLALSKKAETFLSKYSNALPAAELGAKLACDIVQHALSETDAFVHVVSGRAKKPDSLKGKLRKKQYKNPGRQLTDLIGVRIICYYSDHVESIVQRLRLEFEINEKESVDKRNELGLYDFGYRSVHLIAKLKPHQVRTDEYVPLRSNWFEIQVRSILEHAWAEIEHEVVYKSGINYPDTAKRRFARLAGSLELLDSEFLSLRELRANLIEYYKDRYDQHLDQNVSFDVARLLGFLKSTWRNTSDTSDNRLRTSLETSCLQALQAAGMKTATSLGRTIASRDFKRALQEFASLQGIAPTETSHLAIVVLAILVKKPSIIRRHFSEIAFDPTIMRMARIR